MNIYRFAARLLVNDLRKAEEFYSEVFGFEWMDGSTDAGYLLIRSGENYLALIADVGSTPEPPRQTGLVVMCPFPVSRVPAMERGGARVLKRHEPPWGGIQVDFVDPFGNELALYSTGG